MSSSPSSASSSSSSSSSFTVNLVSNSSMSIFSKNTLANFTTLLPNPIELPRSDGRTNGSWQVALLEISWPAKVQNVSQGVFKVVESSGSADNVVSSDYSPSDTSMAAVNNDDDEEEEELEIRPRDNGRSVTFAPVASRNPTTTTTTTTTTIRNLSGQSTTLMLCANDDEDDDSEEVTPQKEFALFSNAASKKRRRKMAPVRRKKSSKSSAAEKSRASVSSDFAASPPHFVHSDNSVGGALSAAAAANRHSLLLPSEKTLEIERGHYNNVRQVLHTILKTAFGTCDRREWPFYCVINEPSQTIKIIPNLTGDDDDDNRESTRTAADVVICLVSNDLRNILGVDCLQFLKPPSPNFPVDISAGRHTMFVYSDLVQCEVLGDRLTSLLRTVVLDHAAAAAGGGGGETFEYNSPAADYSKAPPPPAFTVSHQSGGGGPAVVNYRSFAKLQWKKVVKTTIHSIKVSLMDETGELMPFLSVGRTCLTLMFRFVSNS